MPLPHPNPFARTAQAPRQSPGERAVDPVWGRPVFKAPVLRTPMIDLGALSVRPEPFGPLRPSPAR